MTWWLWRHSESNAHIHQIYTNEMKKKLGKKKSAQVALRAGTGTGTGIGNPTFVIHTDMCMRAAIVHSWSVHVLFPLLGVFQWFYYQQRKQQKRIREKSGSMWMATQCFARTHIPIVYVRACERFCLCVCAYICVNICAPHSLLPAVITSQTPKWNFISALYKVAGLKATSSPQ